MVWTQNFIYSISGEAQFLLPLAFFVVVVFVVNWQTSFCCSMEKGGPHNSTASQSLRNQPLMDVCKTLNRLKWFVGCICFWHYLFWSVNLHLTGSHSTTQTCYSHTPQATLRALLVQKWGPTLHLPTRLACWESLTELTDLKLRNPCYSSF